MGFRDDRGSIVCGGPGHSLFTAGENKWEAMLYGAIMWAVSVVIVLHLGSAGMRTGFNAMAASADAVYTAPVIATANTAQDQENRKLALEAAKRATWYAFFGTWISMFAAVGRALIGAGPTFRIATVATPQRVVVG